MNAAWDGHDHYRDATPLSLNNFDNTAQTDGKYSIGNITNNIVYFNWLKFVAIFFRVKYTLDF